MVEIVRVEVEVDRFEAEALPITSLLADQRS